MATFATGTQAGDEDRHRHPGIAQPSRGELEAPAPTRPLRGRRLGESIERSAQCDQSRTSSSRRAMRAAWSSTQVSFQLVNAVLTGRVRAALCERRAQFAAAGSRSESSSARPATSELPAVEGDRSGQTGSRAQQELSSCRWPEGTRWVADHQGRCHGEESSMRQAEFEADDHPLHGPL